MDLLKSFLASPWGPLASAIAGLYVWRSYNFPNKDTLDWEVDEKRSKLNALEHHLSLGYSPGANEMEGDTCSVIEPSLCAYILAVHYERVIKRIPRSQIPSYRAFTELALTLRGLCLEEYKASTELRDAKFAEPQIDKHPIYRCLMSYYKRQRQSISSYEAVQFTDDVLDENDDRKKEEGMAAVYVGLRFIDAGCGFGTNLRQMAVDGVQMEHLLGVDTEPGFFAGGLVLYSDNNHQSQAVDGDDNTFGMKTKDMASRCVYHDIVTVGSLNPSQMKKESEASHGIGRYNRGTGDRITAGLVEPLASWSALDIRLRDFICPGHAIHGTFDDIQEEVLSQSCPITNGFPTGSKVEETLVNALKIGQTKTVPLKDVSMLPSFHSCTFDNALGMCPISAHQLHSLKALGYEQLSNSERESGAGLTSAKDLLRKTQEERNRKIAEHINILRSPSLAIYSRDQLQYLSFRDSRLYIQGIVRLLCGGRYDEWRRKRRDEEYNHIVHMKSRNSRSPLKVFFGSCLGVSESSHRITGKSSTGHDVVFRSSAKIDFDTGEQSELNWSKWPGYSFSTYQSTKIMERKRAMKSIEKLRFALSKDGYKEYLQLEVAAEIAAQNALKNAMHEANIETMLDENSENASTPFEDQYEAELEEEADAALSNHEATADGATLAEEYKAESSLERGVDEDPTDQAFLSPELDDEIEIERTEYQTEVQANLEDSRRENNALAKWERLKEHQADIQVGTLEDEANIELEHQDVSDESAQKDGYRKGKNQRGKSRNVTNHPQLGSAKKKSGKSSQDGILKKAHQLCRPCLMNSEDNDANEYEWTETSTIESDDESAYESEKAENLRRIASEQLLVSHRHADMGLQHLHTSSSLTSILREHGFDFVSVRESEADIHHGDGLYSQKTREPIALCRLEFTALLKL